MVREQSEYFLTGSARAVHDAYLRIEIISMLINVLEVTKSIYSLTKFDETPDPGTRLYFSEGLWCFESESDLRIAP